MEKAILVHVNVAGKDRRGAGDSMKELSGLAVAAGFRCPLWR